MKYLKHTLHKRLTKYNPTTIPMHMPGHKRNTALLGNRLPYATDITEIHGFDNLHDMQGVLKETANLASLVYGAKASFPLVNGTTCGILAAVHALAPQESAVLIARNCHKSVYNAVTLRNLTPHYLWPKTDDLGVFGSISPAEVEIALKTIPDCRLVILTSPTYDGVISDISALADVCHKYGAYLLVDNAHGAHLTGETIAQSGADVVVMSLHKTMPALTQTALLHIGSDRVDTNAIKNTLSIYETSSPSYVLLSSIDYCLRLWLDKGNALFSTFHRNLQRFYKRTAVLKHLKVLHYDDSSKIIISTKGTSLSGTELSDILRKQYHIEIEMAGRAYVLAMATVCDKRKTFDALSRALLCIDKTLSLVEKPHENNSFPIPEIAYPPKAAQNRAGEWVLLKNAQDRVCLDFVFAYPPGIPLICPGEILSQEVIDMLQTYDKAGITLKSTKGFEHNKIWVEKKDI